MTTSELIYDPDLERTNIIRLTMNAALVSMILPKKHTKNR